MTLYVTSTDKDISNDLGFGEGNSLVLLGRHENRIFSPTSEDDHYAFAYGAFAYAIRDDLADHPEAQISEVDNVPDGLFRHRVGGDENTILTAVYEQPS